MIPGAAPPEDYSFRDKYGISDGFHDVTGRIEVTAPLDPTKRNAVIMILGQSQPASHGVGLYTVQHPDKVHNLHPFNGKLYQMKEPVLGPTYTLPVGSCGSYSGLLGDKLIAAGFDRAVIANIGIGGIPARDMAPAGPYHHWITNTMKRLRALSMPLTHVLYHQGESDSFHLQNTPPAVYEAQVRSVVQTVNNFWPVRPRFIVGLATWLPPSVYNPPTDAGIRAAQMAINVENGTTTVPDFDSLGSQFRDDGLHFGLPSGGQAFVAEMWTSAILANPYGG